MTKHTYLREIRNSFKLDVTVAMLVKCVQEGHTSLSIIKFDKMVVLALVSTKQPQGQVFMILQMVSRYVCYNGDSNFSCITMSIRLEGVL